MSRRQTEMPLVFAELIDAVCERDRRYFEEHAWQQDFERDYVPGEFWPHDQYVDAAFIVKAKAGPLRVLVVSLAPPLGDGEISTAYGDTGYRLRHPLFNFDALGVTAEVCATRRPE